MSKKRTFGALAAMIAAGLSGMAGGDCEKGKKVGNPLQKACADYTKRKKPLNR